VSSEYPEVLPGVYRTILRDEKGKPYFNPLGDVKKTIINLGITKTHVSLADESEHAIAFAILEI